MFNPAIVPAGANSLPFKYIEVMLDEETGVWLALVFYRQAYEMASDGDKITPSDSFSALDEVTLISRVKKEYPYIVIAKTSGEIKTTPM
jgi:hypothetical protein